MVMPPRLQLSTKFPTNSIKKLFVQLIPLGITVSLPISIHNSNPAVIVWTLLIKGTTRAVYYCSEMNNLRCFLFL